MDNRDKFRYVKRGDDYIPAEQVIGENQKEIEKSIKELDRIIEMWNGETDTSDDFELS